MKNFLLFFLIFSFFGTIFGEVSEDVYVTGSSIKKSSLLVANPISSFDLDDIKRQAKESNLIYQTYSVKNNWVTAHFTKK